MHKNVFLLMADCEGTLDEFIPITYYFMSIKYKNFTIFQIIFFQQVSIGSLFMFNFA